MLDTKNYNDGKSPVYKMMYNTFVQNTLPEVRKIYDYFHIPYTEETERKLQTYLDYGPKKNKYGVHSYSLEKYGITMAQLKQEFTVYETFMSRFTDDVI